MLIPMQIIVGERKGGIAPEDNNLSVSNIAANVTIINPRNVKSAFFLILPVD